MSGSSLLFLASFPAGRSGHLRVMPGTVAGSEILRLLRAPSVGLVLEDRRRRPQDRLDNSPGMLDGILAREERGIAFHRVMKQPLVRIHPRSTALGDHQLDRAAG